MAPSKRCGSSLLPATAAPPLARRCTSRRSSATTCSRCLEPRSDARGATKSSAGGWAAPAWKGDRVPDVAEEVGAIIAGNGIVAWFEGSSEYGPRALGHRSLLASAAYAENPDRLNDVKGREQFRPVAPMVLLERADEIFTGGPIPSPYMLFTHDVRPEWRERIPAVVHVDGSARIQTIDR